MWAIEALDPQKGIKPEITAYFHDKEEAIEYAEYLATVNVEATVKQVERLYICE